MEPLSLPNQREPCKVEKIVLVPPCYQIALSYLRNVLVPPDWKNVLVPPDWKNVLVPPDWKNVLVPPDWKNVLVPPDWKNVLVPPDWKNVLVPPDWKNVLVPPANKLLQKCVIFNKAINVHSRGPTEQYLYVWEPHRGCCL